MGAGSSSPTAPPPRDLGAESSAILGLQQQSGEQQMEMLNALISSYPRLAKYEREATTKQRAQDVLDLGKSGPGYMEAYRASSPVFAAGEDALTSEIGMGQRTSPLLQKLNADAMAAGASPIRSELERQAMTDLGLGRSLSAQELRDSDQASRAAYSSRGMVMSNPAIAGEILNRDMVARARESERRGFAGSVAGLGISEDQSNRNFQTSVQSANEAGTGNWRNFLGSSVQIGGNSPVLGMMGQRTPVPVTAPAALMGAVSSSGSPAWSYGSDLFNTNYNAGAAANIAGQNKPSPWATAGAGAASGASIGTAVYPGIGTAIGAIAGGVGGYFMCWVAREIFGDDCLQWAWFRLWLEREASPWFRWLYVQFGPVVAAVLRAVPALKPWLEPWFDVRAWKMRNGASSADQRRVLAIFNEYHILKEEGESAHAL